MRLFLIFIIVPVIEIALFIEVGGMIGTWPTVGLIVLTAFAGSWLLRRQGMAAMREVQDRLMAVHDARQHDWFMGVLERHFGEALAA